MEYEQFDITLSNPDDLAFVRETSIVNILKTGKIRTFHYGQNEFIWLGVDTSFSDPFGLTKDGIEKIEENTLALVKNIEWMKERFLTEIKAPLVSVIHDFNGVKGLLFRSNSVNFVIPYLSISDYDESVASEFRKSIIETSGENPIVIVELSESVSDTMRLKKVDFTVDWFVPMKTIPLHRVSETIDEFTNLLFEEKTQPISTIS